MSRNRPRTRRSYPTRAVCATSGKQRYGDEATALAVLSDLAMREKRGQKLERTEGLVAYRCQGCDGWHLGRRR